MDTILHHTHTAFLGNRRLASGQLSQVALAVKRALAKRPTENLFIFDDSNGRVVDINTVGSDEDIAARYADRDIAEEPRGRGRPKLGVVAREVTLLPRHWEWLSTQPGGASVALRKLVDEARRSGKYNRRAAQDAAYRFMSGMAGDFVNFEEAIRALFAADHARFTSLISDWPSDIRDYATRLAASAFED
jgi:hypothetical protein